MNEKFKKIMKSSLVSALTITTLGSMAACPGCNNSNNAKAQTPTEKLGKIVETSTTNFANENSYMTQNNQNYLSDTNSQNIEDNISNNNSSMSLFVLSETPYITMSTDDNNSHINMYINLSKTSGAKQTNSSSETNSDSYNLKRSILTIYTSELYKGNITLDSNERYNLEQQLNQSSTASANTSNVRNTNQNSQIDSVINILESNLNQNSCYYNKNLTEITRTLGQDASSSSEYKTLADKITSTFNLKQNTPATQNLRSNDSQSINSNSRTNRMNNTTSQNNIQNSRQSSNTNTESNNENNQSSNLNQNNNSRSYINNQNNNVNGNYINNSNRTTNDQTTNNIASRNNNQTSGNSYINNTSRNIQTTNQNDNENSQKTMRADRTPKNEYISPSSRILNNRPRASRTPYQELNNSVN